MLIFILLFDFDAKPSIYLNITNWISNKLAAFLVHKWKNNFLNYSFFPLQASIFRSFLNRSKKFQRYLLKDILTLPFRVKPSAELNRNLPNPRMEIILPGSTSLSTYIA